MNKWKVNITGIDQGGDIKRLSQGLSEKFELPTFKVESIINSIPCTIKRKLDKEIAQSYVKALEEIGFTASLELMEPKKEEEAKEHSTIESSPPAEINEKSHNGGHSKFYRISLMLGFTLLFALLLPHAGHLLKNFTGGMYGPIFKPYPHYVFLSIYLICKYSLALLYALVFMRIFKFKERLPEKENGKWMFLAASIVILIPQILQLWTSSIQGGGASFALGSLSRPYVRFATLLLIIGVVKVLMGYKAPEIREPLSIKKKVECFLEAYRQRSKGVGVFVNASVITLLSLTIYVAYQGYSESKTLQNGYSIVYEVGSNKVNAKGKLINPSDAAFYRASNAVKKSLESIRQEGLCIGSTLQYRHATGLKPARWNDNGISYIVSYLSGRSLLTGSNCKKAINIKEIDTSKIADKYFKNKPNETIKMGFLTWEGKDSIIMRSTRNKRDFLISGVHSSTLNVREIKYRDDLDGRGKKIKSKS